MASDIDTSVIRARLDSDSIRSGRQEPLGESDSQIVRVGSKSLSALARAKSKRKIVGMGQFESWVPGLGSNPKRLKGFGK